VVRDTQQRDAIRSTLMEAGRPLSIGELLQSARRKVAALGIATVYRNLKAMQTAGEIAPVEFPGRAPFWEIAPAAHHHHFICSACEKVYEVKGCLGDFKRLLPEGCVLEQHEVLLQGKCSSCVRAA
jgi:Fur family transcriptional regulator, ferric uptake regulator